MSCRFDGNIRQFLLQDIYESPVDQLLLLAYSLKPTNNGPKTYQKVSRNGQNCHYNAIYMDLVLYS